MTYIDMEKGVLSWEEWMEMAIDRLYEEYAAAPETVDIEPISGQFETEEDSGFSLVYGRGYSDEFGFENFQVYNGAAGPGGSAARYTRTVTNDISMDYELKQNVSSFWGVDLAKVPDVTVSAEDARALCDELVDKLDIPGMACYSVLKKYGGGSGESFRCCWEVQYTRLLGEIPVTHAENNQFLVFSMGDMNGGAFQVPWEYEALTFYVNDDGIVAMKWTAPYELGEAEAEDSALLPFADVMDIFEKMYIVDNDGQQMDVTVSDIRLGYTRVLKQNESGVGLMVPVWDFFGVRTYEDGRVYDHPEESLLTVNAIDGSIIDRHKAY